VEPSPEILVHLHRVGVTYARAGAADCVQATDLGDELWILGPPRLRPRPTWTGSSDEALALLKTLPDDAGPEAFWTAFGGRAS
jgi:hypothetical protein